MSLSNMVSLSYSEVALGAFVGIMRRLEAMRRQGSETHGAKRDDGWARDIEGALGEMALAKFLGVYWSKGKCGEKDVAGQQVRMTTHPNGRLLLHEDDSDDDVFWLVRGAYGAYDIAGCIVGRDGKMTQWWDEPEKGRPCFCVPASALKAEP